jgi:ectoine hydroxylase-related dioxygenase (phytanoyl-CoA dioxygenase family)
MNQPSGFQDPERNGLSQFDLDGFEILPDVFPPDKCDILANELSLLYQQKKEISGNKLGGLRNLLRLSPQVNELAHSPELNSVLNKRLNHKPFPIRALFFDKTPDANWRVAWHQDVTIAVAEKIETPGFEAWSVKEEVVHVQPPSRILEGMATIRLHLDNCHAKNGALKVIPGSHLEGKLGASRIKECSLKGKTSICEVSKGGVLLMRPLLLHSSSPSETPSHRRILHIEYASDKLPNGLKWFDRP